jgi:hypothetical protein
VIKQPQQQIKKDYNTSTAYQVNDKAKSSKVNNERVKGTQFINRVCEGIKVNPYNSKTEG